MALSLKELAKITKSSILGDEKILLKDIASLDTANNEQISFLSNPKYIKQLASTQAKALILTPDLAKEYLSQKPEGNILVNNDPYLTFAKVVNAFYSSKNTSSKHHTTASISKQATIGDNCHIAANVVIEKGVVIGNGVSINAGCVIAENSIIKDHVTLHANVTIYSDTHIGEHSIIHSGAIIGADGFGFALQKDKSWYKILQVGNVIIGDNVEVGASTTIDRAALGSTVISNGVKLDNQIQIGHNVQLGEHTIIAAGTLVAGSTKIGKRCQIGGAVAISGHLTIVDDVTITGGSMVIKSLLESNVYSSGIGSDTNRQWKRNVIRFSQLNDMAMRLKKVEKQLKDNS